MTIGIQFDTATGIISGTISPAINTDVQPMPEGRGQLIVADGTDYTGMKVDPATFTLVVDSVA